MLPTNADKIFYDSFSFQHFWKEEFHIFLCLRPQILWSCFRRNNNWCGKNHLYVSSLWIMLFSPRNSLRNNCHNSRILKNHNKKLLFREKVTTKKIGKYFWALLPLNKRVYSSSVSGWTFPKATILVHY